MLMFLIYDKETLKGTAENSFFDRPKSTKIDFSRF
jgi:hypothetical protein